MSFLLVFMVIVSIVSNKISLTSTSLSVVKVKKKYKAKYKKNRKRVLCYIVVGW